MAVYLTFGYQQNLDPGIVPYGSLILASTITSHTLLRRKIDKLPHFKNRLFDPQLYMAGLDPNQSKAVCATLSSYPWFAVKELQEFDSDLQSQANWKKETLEKMISHWPRKPINPDEEPELVNDAIRDCIDFQLRVGCEAIILPSPLTSDPGTDYSHELYWLDRGLEYISSKLISSLPIYATVALNDNCLRYSDPLANPLLALILDTVGAREINGVYLVVEVGSESNMTRHISNTRVLWSALHMTHLFKNDCRIKVGVNFFGPFGLALEAAGADFWATGWYKSEYRLRLADKIRGGLAYPSYWSYPAAADIHLENDFDTLNSKGFLNRFANQTPACAGLLKAASQGARVRSVPDWQYRTNNVTAAKNHYRYSVIQSENSFGQLSVQARLDYIENQWLSPAASLCSQIKSTLGPQAKTNPDHVQAWLDAFTLFRRDHNV